MMKQDKIIVITGPTASGKTSVGVRLAKEFNGEIVSADSRQVYRGLDLGTGKDLAEYDGVKYHMIDVVGPGTDFSMFKYLDKAREAIDDILSRGKLPIVVGGTGLYIQGLVEGFALKQIDDQAQDHHPYTPPQRGGDKEGRKYSREELGNFSVDQLIEILQKIDLKNSENIDQKNPHRLIRAIELAQEGLEPVKIKPDFEALQIAIDLPRKELFERIDKRVDERFEEGMLEEVKGLIESGVDPEWLMKLGLEYREITGYLIACHFDPLQRLEKSLLEETKKDLSTAFYSARDDSGEGKKLFEEMVQNLKYKIHQYARRQLTWLHRFPEINWLSNYDEIKRFVKIFLTH